jgi:hypothetical protein
MEVSNVNNLGSQKAEGLKETRLANSRSVNAYAKAGQKDSVDVSSEAKLLHKLRTTYDKLPEATSNVKAQDVKERTEQGVTSLSSEEIVTGILKGTLFEVI